MLNLDFLCMKTAQEMMACQGKAGDKENVATAGLGVLLENGPYGLVLFLESHSKTDIAGRYKEQLIALCREELVASYLSGGVPTSGNFQAVTKWLRGLAEDLDRYLFTKRLWQQTLTYARYHAKALEKGSEAGPGGAREEGE
ncbi:MAG: hypothetical protein HY690_05140 [Chloroflexi bacterium]|nr:hypothetical protein [Chloroflexota bacterium]